MSKKAWLLSVAYLFVVFVVFFALIMRSDQKKVQVKEDMDVLELVDVFNLVVDYDRPLKDSIAAGRYDCINKDITEENFPPDKEEQGKKEVVLKLFRFNRDYKTNSDAIKFEEVIRKIVEEECQPTSWPELLALGEAKPELQRRSSIVAMKFGWVRNGRGMTGLWGNSDIRGLGVGWCNGGWGNPCLFLAISATAKPLGSLLPALYKQVTLVP